jgi:hypothetical protein
MPIRTIAATDTIPRMAEDLRALAEKARAADTERKSLEQIGAERSTVQMRDYADRVAALGDECRQVAAAVRRAGAITEGIVRNQDGFTRWRALPKPDLIIPGWLLINHQSGDREETGHDGLAIVADNGELVVLGPDNVYSHTWDASHYVFPHTLERDEPFGHIREALGRLLARYDAEGYL